MKKIVLAASILLASFIPHENDFYRIRLNIYNNPVKVYEYMFSNFSQSDDNADSHEGDDYMQTPFETFIRRSGDCEDWDNFAKYMIDSSKIYAFYEHGSEDGHALLVFRDKDKFGVIDNAKYIDINKRFNSVLEIGRTLCKNLGKTEEIVEDYNETDNMREISVYKN